MKYKIVDIHEEDAHYDYCDEIVGTIFSDERVKLEKVEDTPVKKWKIVDVHPGSMHYRNRFAIIGEEISDEEVKRLEDWHNHNGWKAGFVAISVADVRYICGIKIEPVEELTEEKAIELSIKKWEWLRDNPDKYSSNVKNHFPELSEYKAGCALCGLYLDGEKHEECPLYDNHNPDANCCVEHGRWCFAHETYDKAYWAEQLLNKLYKIRDAINKEKEIEAIEGSIKKWEDIATSDRIEKGHIDCPLCHIYRNVNETIDCKGCPIKEKTGELVCGNTPYYEWEEHHRNHHNIHIRCSQCPKCRSIAQKEVDFLKSLLPEKKTPVGTVIDASTSDSGTVAIKYLDSDSLPKPKKEEFTFDKGLKMTVEKWTDVVKNNGEPIPNVKCGFCKYFYGCKHCPLNDDNRYCCTEYNAWSNSTDEKLKWAVKLLNRIYDIKERYESGELKID